ncbi:MAG: hypothetical protein M3N38_10515 [Pseudomonadota bacterium]|nr:hypothetical protein [Pseudomonadota bacterium]
MLVETGAVQTLGWPARWALTNNRRALTLALFASLLGVAVGYAATSDLPSTRLDGDLFLLLRFGAPANQVYL